MEARGKGCGCGSVRYGIVLMASLAFANMFCLRSVLSIAILAMVKQANETEYVDEECGNATGANPQQQTEGEFEWSHLTQGIVLSSFFYGYVVTQIPAIWFGAMLGNKNAFGIGVFGSAVCGLLTPEAARLHVGALIAVRTTQGLFEGLTFANMHALLSRWVPQHERGKLVTLTYAGGQVGSAVAFPVAGFLCQYGFDGGWPSSFYLFGCTGMLWSVFWALLASESPADNPRISAEERNMIESSIGSAGLRRATLSEVPWRRLLVSAPFWAINFVSFFDNWGFYTLLTGLPTFIKEVLHFDLTKNSFLSSAPYIAMWAFGTAVAAIVDWLVKKKTITVVTARKGSSALGCLGPAACLAAVGYAGCHIYIVIALIVVAVGLNGAANVGFQVNHLDIAPRYAGVLMAVANFHANVAGVVAPQVMGIALNAAHSMREWRLIFLTSSGMYVCGTFLFVIMASGEEQEWAKGYELLHSSSSRRSSIDAPGTIN